LRPEPLRISHEADGTSHTLRAEGELDVVGAPALEAAVARICADGAREVVLDLHTLDFIDSAGLRAVLHSRRCCEEHGCDFALARVRPPAQRVLEVSGLLGRLTGRGRSNHTRHGAEEEPASAASLGARQPDLEVPLELNLAAPRSARSYVRDLLSSHGSRELREAAMLLTSDLVTPAAARAPANFLQTGELRVWVHGDLVRVELLVPSDLLPVAGGPEAIYDAKLFARLGATLLLDAPGSGARAAFEVSVRTAASGERETTRPANS
jgi:anti-sigma B factor antagonist